MRLFLLILMLGFAMRGNTATINAASPNRSDIDTAIAAASNGDTINIPAGTGTGWTTKLTLTKTVKWIGAGVGQTIIVDAVAADYFMDITLQPGYVMEWSGIEFQNSGALANDRIYIKGRNNDGSAINIHHCKFNQMASAVFTMNTVRGVVWTNTFIGNGVISVLVAHTKDSAYDSSNVTDNDTGNASYAADNFFGTTNFVFFEQNLITNSVRCAAMDGQAGARYVFRFNTCYKVTAETHGSEASERSGRAFEIYGNYFYGDGSGSTPIFMRGGVTLCFSNVFTNWSAGAALSLLDNRVAEELFPPFGGGSGINPWDSNNVTGVFASGTITGTNGNTSITNSSATYTSGQYTNYTIRRTSGKTVTALTRSSSTATATVTNHGFTSSTWVSFWGANEYGWNHIFQPITILNDNQFTFTVQYNFPTPATGTILCAAGNSFSRILQINGDWIRYYDSIFEPSFPAGLRFAIGDTYEIRKIEASIDQCGVWGGTNFGLNLYPDLINNFAGSQTISACYEWENTHNGGDINWQRTGAFGTLEHIKPNVHYFDDTAKPGYTPLGEHYLVSGDTPPETPGTNAPASLSGGAKLSGGASIK